MNWRAWAELQSLSQTVSKQFGRFALNLFFLLFVHLDHDAPLREPSWLRRCVWSEGRGMLRHVSFFSSRFGTENRSASRTCPSPGGSPDSGGLGRARGGQRAGSEGLFGVASWRGCLGSVGLGWGAAASGESWEITHPWTRCRHDSFALFGGQLLFALSYLLDKLHSKHYSNRVHAPLFRFFSFSFFFLFLFFF